MTPTPSSTNPAVRRSEALRTAHELLPPDRQSGDYLDDLAEAARTLCRTLQTAKRQRHILLAAMREAGLTWETIHDLTGIPTATVRRWADDAPDHARYSATDQGD